MQVIGSHESANKATRESAISYTWLPGQAAIIIPRPRLRNNGENGAIAASYSHAIDAVTAEEGGTASNNSGLWHTATVQ